MHYNQPETSVRTPWGNADHVVELKRGVRSVSTPRHGGILVAPTTNHHIPVGLRHADGAYEEDCDYAIPMYYLSFTDDQLEGVWMEPPTKERMQATIEQWNEFGWKYVNGLLTQADLDSDEKVQGMNRRDAITLWDRQRQYECLPKDATHVFCEDPVGIGQHDYHLFQLAERRGRVLIDRYPTAQPVNASGGRLIKGWRGFYTNQSEPLRTIEQQRLGAQATGQGLLHEI